MDQIRRDAYHAFLWQHPTVTRCFGLLHRMSICWPTIKFMCVSAVIVFRAFLVDKALEYLDRRTCAAQLLCGVWLATRSAPWPPLQSGKSSVAFKQTEQPPELWSSACPHLPKL